MHLRLGCLGALLVLLVGAPAQSQVLRPAGEPVRLVAEVVPALHPVWSPDGSQIAFTRAKYDGIWLVSPDGGDARQLSDADGAGFGFEWSPDGTAIVARTSRYDGLRRYSAVTVLDAATGAAQALTEERTFMPALPHWAGPGHVVLVADGEVDVLVTDPAARIARPESVVLAADGALAVADPATGAVRRITPLPDVQVLNPAVSPDGRRVAFEVLGGNLFVLDLEGSGLTDLGRGERPTWSPDGRWVAFQVTEDDGHTFTASDLVAARVDGSARVVLTQSPARLEMNPSWSPDGRRIAFDDFADGALYLLPVTE